MATLFKRILFFIIFFSVVFSKDDIWVDLKLPTQTIIYVLQKNNNIHVRWSGHKQVYTRLYMSSDIQNWTPVAFSRYEQGVFQIPLRAFKSTPIFFKLVSVDKAHLNVESLSSDIYSIHYRNDNLKKILIVDGFDRISGGWQSNQHQFSSMLGQAINRDSYIFETAANEAVHQGFVDLEDYSAVLWLLGDESVKDESLSEKEQDLIKQYLRNGGNLFISGSNIALDLGLKGNEKDKEFLNYTLHSEYVKNKSGTAEMIGTENRLFLEKILSLDDELYQSVATDVIKPVYEGKAELVFDNKVGSAAVSYMGYMGGGKRQYDGEILSTDKIGRLVYLSFPFETINKEAEKKDLMSAILYFFEKDISAKPIERIHEKKADYQPSIVMGSPLRDISIKSPSSRILQPGTFPTFVFLLFNHSDKKYSLDFDVLLPQGWSIISIKKPSNILSQEKEKVRITCSVPRYTIAEKSYALGLISEWGSNTDTSFVGLKINPDYNISVETKMTEKQIISGRSEIQSFVFQNKGNMTDTLFLEVLIPNNWEMEKLEKNITLAPQERKIIDIGFTIPLTDSLKIQDEMTMIVTSLGSKRMGKNLIIKKSIILHILQPRKKKKEETFFNKIPLNMGFTLNRLQEGFYPEIALFINTDRFEIGETQLNFELVEKSQAVSTSENPSISTEQIKLSIMGSNFIGLAGDISLETNPLLSQSSSITLADYQPQGETGRGLFGSYTFSNVTATGFYGQKIYTDEILSQINTKYSLSDSTTASATYLNLKNNQNLALEWISKLGGNKSWAALAGLSRGNGVSELDGAAQIRGKTTIKNIPILGRLHWAGDSYTGTEKGKMGLVLSSRWTPTSEYYLWGNIHGYIKSYSEAINDSSILVLDLATRSIIRHQQWPSINLGLNFRQDKSTSGESIYNHLVDLRFQKHIRYGLPTLSFSWSNKYNQFLNEQQREIKIMVGWLSYFTNSRIKFEQKLHKVNASQWGAITSLFTGIVIKGYMLDVFLKNGRKWQYSGQDEYTNHQISNYGLRSTFGFQPFGKNYNVNLEVGKVASDMDEFSSDWRISVSISAKTVPRFYIPVPTILTNTGRVTGEVFVDNNNNGIRDVDEKGVSQILLFLRENDVMTDADGLFEFTPQETGEYEFVLDEATLPAYLGISKLVPKSISVRKGSFVHLTIPLVSIGSISGVLFNDTNRNGLLDQNELGLKKVRIIIQNTDGQEWEAFTNEKGQYKITDLLPAIYTIMIDQRWLPKRIIPLNRDEKIKLTQDLAQQKLNVAVVKKRLKIKKTFSAPKKN